MNKRVNGEISQESVNRLFPTNFFPVFKPRSIYETTKCNEIGLHKNEHGIKFIFILKGLRYRAEGERKFQIAYIFVHILDQFVAKLFSRQELPNCYLKRYRR